MNEFGEFIKEKRKEKGKSIREASREIGISHTYLDSLEKGYDPRTKKQRNPGIETIAKLSGYYDVTVEKMIRLSNSVKFYNVSDDVKKEYFEHVRNIRDGFLNVKKHDITVHYLDRILTKKSSDFEVWYDGERLTDTDKKNINQLISIYIHGKNSN